METTAVAAIDGVVNGPEGERLDWDAVQWRHVEQDVRRLRQRIFAVSRAGDLKKVRNLQKLMLRSRSNALVAVRRVTELNAGRKTAGVDGKVVVTAEQKAELADWMQHHAARWSPRPVKRVYVVRRVALCCIPNSVGINSEVLAATFSEDEGVTLTAVVWECRRPCPGVRGGALVVMSSVWCSRWRHDR
ncbi:MAG: reverse transcriptase N-terminal domain-containing protein, partial [Pseudonocardiaceae bacterium]